MVDQMLCLHIPAKNGLLFIEPGTGDQLLSEDKDAGYNDYLNWSFRSLSPTLDPYEEPDDGGLILFDHNKEKFCEDLRFAIPAALKEAFGDEPLRYQILSEPRSSEFGEQSTMLTISTAHISAATRRILAKQKGSLPEIGVPTYQKDGWGWLLYINDLEINHIKIAIKKLSMGEPTEDYPLWESLPDLAQCLLFARREGADVLCFDSDAVMVEGLEVYN